MKLVLNVLTASGLARIFVGASIALHTHSIDKSLSVATVELLTSFENCIVYMLNWGCKNGHKDTYTEYIRRYSETMNCAVIADTWYQLRNKPARNPRFVKVEPHPLFTKYTNTFWEFIAAYNIPFNYVILFMSKEEFASIDNSGMVSKFVKISSPAVYMLILDKHDVNVIGFAQALRSAPFLFRVTKFKEANIRQLHESVHVDLQGALALIMTGSSGSGGICKFGKPLLQHYSYCAIYEMASSFNMAILTQQGYAFAKPIIIVIQAAFVIDTNNLAHVLRQNFLSFQVVNYLIGYEDLSFVCIARTNVVGLMAFVKAYDMLTWVYTTGACIFLTTTVAAMTAKMRMSFWEKCLSVAPAVLMFLIERFYGHSQIIRSASRQIVLTLTLWALGAMLLGMGFSGNMVSKLTSPSLPSCPKDMKELAMIEKYPILSDTEQALMTSAGPVWTPFFHLEIDDYLKVHADSNGTLSALLRQFRKKLTHVNDIERLNVSNYKTSSEVLYAYAESTVKVKVYRIWSVMQSRNIHVLNGGNLPYFTMRAPVLVQGNFIAPQIQRFLANLLERGVLNFWSDIRMAVRVNSNLKHHAKLNKIELREALFRKANLAAIWRNFDPPLHSGNSWNAMALENVNAVFSFLGIGMLLSLFVMFIEICPWTHRRVGVHFLN